MNQAEIKNLASQIVGDGESPNKYFVTHSAYCNVVDDDGEVDMQLIDGFSDDATTFGPFETYKEALEKFNDIDVDEDLGIGHVMIEDRLVGTLIEKGLELRMVKKYNTYEYVTHI